MSGVDALGPVTTQTEESIASWAVEIIDRLSAGETIDLDSLALDYPAGVEKVRRLLPLMARMSRLRPPSGADSGNEAGSGPSRTSVEPRGDLGDFRTIRVIGRGGMGVVYEAVQISLNRRVALKVLPMTSADEPRKLKRFQIEAQAAALLNHPHIVPVYLVGAEKGAHFYAMQLIEGRTLAEVITEFRRERGTTGEPTASNASGPSARFAADLGRQAARALDHAHEQGILHRDVKPSNLLIESSGWLWVADFGLARIAVEADQTSTGVVMGTLRYMSPEQITGSRRVVDHRADVYSLGATLYELIMLRPAFDHIDHVELIMKIARDEPRRPRAIDPAIPRDLETIVLKAMAKDPSARYTTAGELADDLGRFLERRPILARQPGAIDRAAKWMRRHKPAVVATGLFLLMAVIGLGGFVLWRDGVLRQHNRELTSALERAERTESTIRRHTYDSQMGLAQRSSTSGQVELAQELLDGLRPEPGARDLRGFEWYYLRSVCHRDVSVLSRHEALTTARALASDGLTLVTGHHDGVTVFWDLGAARERVRLRAHARSIYGLKFSPGGSILASWATDAGAASEVRIWDPITASPLVTIPGITGYVIGVAFVNDNRELVILEHDLKDDPSKDRLVFWSLGQGTRYAAPGRAPILCSRMAQSQDGRWLATGPTSGRVTLRDATTGAPITTLAQSFPWIAEIAASPDGHTLAVCEGTGISFWDVATASKRGFVPCSSTLPPAFSPDGDRLAALTDGPQSILLVADVKTVPRQVPLEFTPGETLDFALSPDGKILAGGGIGLPATHWDTSSGRKLAEFTRTGKQSRGLIFGTGSRSLIVPDEDGPIRVWHFDKTPKPNTRLDGHQKEVWALAYAPDGQTLLSASDDHSIKLWNPRDGRLQSTLTGHDALVTSLAINRSGTLLASASFDETVRLWALPGGKPGPVLRGHTDRVRALTFSPDGKTLASAGSDKTVRLWDLERGETEVVLTDHTEAIRALAFDPSGSWLVSTGDDQTIRVTARKEARKSFALACPNPNSTLAFSADGITLAVGDDSGNISFWDVGTWVRRSSVRGSDAAIWGVAFSPDDRTLAAACGDGKVRLWDPVSGQIVLVLEGHTQRVNAVAFSPDGQTLASADHMGDIKLWQAGPPAR
jgi:eukaryotic-like serine/threonine-protein kinase